MSVAFLDLTRQHKEIEKEATVALTRVMNSGAYILGCEVSAFEVEWARFCGVRGAATVGNGTDALALALLASGAINKGRDGRRDEVITTPLSAAYTALAILNAGATPVFADIDPQTLTLSPQAVEESITPHTRAIVPVHIYGQMADMDALCDVAARHDLLVIEDAAQAHGATLRGKRAGAHGHAGAFSFYPTKNLGGYGDAGAVVSNDAALIEQVKILRQGGHPPALRETTAGRNSRMDEMQAALLRVKLKRLASWNERRKAIAEIYRAGLSSTEIELPSVGESGTHAHHLFVAQHSKRDRLRSHLAQRGIETLIHYPYLLHQQTLFQQTTHRALPVAERVAERIFSLPLYPQLEAEEARAVVEAILDFEA